MKDDNMKQTTWIVLGWLVLGCAAQAASFDCAKAGSKVEHLICDNPKISELDSRLGQDYQDVLGKANEEQKQRVIAAHTPSDGGESDVFTSGSIDMDQSGRSFELVEGKGVEVCEIYKKNLEALGNPNLACERKVSPEYQGIIKLPEWRKLDLWENRNLWAQVEKMGIGGINRPGWMESKDTPMDDQRTIDNLAERYHADIQRYNREVYKLNVANMDVDNDGKSELVLREHSGLCGEPVHYTAIALFVLNEKGDMVDLQKSRPLFQDSGSNRWSKEVQKNGIFGIGSMYDIFSYKDKTYFDRWTWTGVWVYKISNGKTEAICRLN